jgi:hypothetical protein
MSDPTEPRNYLPMLLGGTLTLGAGAACTAINYEAGPRTSILLALISAALLAAGIALTVRGWWHRHMRQLAARDAERAEWVAENVIPGPWDTRPLPEVPR